MEDNNVPILHKVRGTGAGKGDKQRPCSISREAYGKNFDRIFRKAKKRERSK